MKILELASNATVIAVCLLLNQSSTVHAAENSSGKVGGKDHCYALVLGGGGTRGAYEAGVMWGLIHNAEDKSKYAYDVVSGVSAGSINGGALAIFEPGDELNAVEAISETWQELSTKNIYKRWFPFGLI